jgi:hypothetical protein
VNLALGDNPFSVQATDSFGQTSKFSLSIDRLAQSGSANAALVWNQLALSAIKNDASTPEFASRALGMESLAVFDVVSAIDGTPGYLVNMSAPSDADVNAAVAQAAHDVLAYLFPDQKASFDAQLASTLGAIANGQGKTDGIAFGQSVAAKIIALRANTAGTSIFSTKAARRSANGSPRRPATCRHRIRNGPTSRRLPLPAPTSSLPPARRR